MSAALSEFIGLLVDGIVDFGQGIGQGLSQTVQALFLEVDATTNAVTGLSTFGGVMAIFAGVSLTIGFVSLIFYWITSLGK